MARGAQVESLWSGLFDDSGQALAGGKVYTYDAGTTTPKVIYTDSALTTPAANPVILDGEGRSLNFANGAYKFVVKTSADVTLYTLDNLYYFEPDSWGTWTPAYGGNGGTVWSPTPTTTLATYILIKDLCFFSLLFNGTISSGSSITTMTATLPFTAAAVGGPFWSSGIIVLPGSSYSIAIAQTSSGTNTLTIYKYDIGATNWGTGTAGAQISGFYKIA